MEHIRTKVVTLRKERRCWGCRDRYVKREQMTVCVNADGGRAFSTYWCAVCMAYSAKYIEYGDDIFEGDFTFEPHYQDFKQTYHVEQFERFKKLKNNERGKTEPAS